MQTHKQRKHLTAFIWLLLLLHPIVGMGMAQGAVLCLTPDGHFAIEVPHAKTGCVAAHKVARSPLSETSLKNPSNLPCSDISVFADGSHLTIPSGGELLSPACQRTVVFILSQRESSAHQPLHFQDALVPPPSSYTSLRGIILLV